MEDDDILQVRAFGTPRCVTLKMEYDTCTIVAGHMNNLSSQMVEGSLWLVDTYIDQDICDKAEANNIFDN